VKFKLLSYSNEIEGGLMEYTCTTFRKDFAKIIDEHIQNAGFSSRGEFIRYCVQQELRKKQGGQ
jgi:metal-responsive CopG/Arc/MetJ family transcriptional regulator